MKLLGDRQATKTWCRERRDVYAQRLGLTTKPRIYWSLTAWDAAVPRDERNLMNGDKGGSSHSRQLIYLSLDDQLCRHDADDTIAHELVHLRWPSLAHTKEFFRRVAALKRGVRFGSHGSPLPAAL